MSASDDDWDVDSLLLVHSPRRDEVFGVVLAEEREGVDAPPASRYSPVWQLEAEVTELDLTAQDVTSIVWAIGYRPDYRWIEASAFDGGGRPMQNRGVTTVEGLTFIGLPWMHTWGSGRFLGIDRDAKHIATKIIDDLRHRNAPRLAVAR